jgi:hypothetical protein
VGTPLIGCILQFSYWMDFDLFGGTWHFKMPKRRRGSGLHRIMKHSQKKRAVVDQTTNEATVAMHTIPIDTPQSVSTPMPTKSNTIAKTTVSANTSCGDSPQSVAALTPTNVIHTTDISSNQRRVAWVVYFVDNLDAPPQHEWNTHKGTIHEILTVFQLKESFRKAVKRALDDFISCTRRGLAYNGDFAAHGGQNKLIQLDSVESQIIADCIENGWSITQTTHMVNHHRLQQNKTHVGRTAVYGAYLRLCPQVSSMAASKQGSSDIDSPWAKARLAWARQLGVRLGIWSWQESLGPLPPTMDPSKLSKLKLAQIVV